MALTPRILEDADGLLVLDKPAGLSMTADRTGAPELWSWLQQHLEASRRRPYLVHRLDKGTSGVLLVATEQHVQSALTRAFAARVPRKFYIAECVDERPAGAAGPRPGNGRWRIELPLRKARKSRYRVAAPRESIRAEGGRMSAASREPGLAATTLVRALERTADGQLRLLAMPRTGRTHQLRVHLCWIGLPIAGDHLYPRPSPQPGRLRLHCHRLVFPWQGRMRSVSAPLPLPWDGVASGT